LYLLIWTFIFVTSLFVLVKASDYFVRSAEKIGFYMRISPFIIGVTILAIGTSLPELFSSVFAVLMGSSEIVLGNVIGSNITNIFLILGLSAVVGGKMKTTYDLVHVDRGVCFSLGHDYLGRKVQLIGGSFVPNLFDNLHIVCSKR